MSVSFGFAVDEIVNEGRLTMDDIASVRTQLVNGNFPKLQDEQIALFLLSCDNEQEAAYKTIASFYSIRNEHPRLFSARKMGRDDLKRQMETVNIFVLPEKTDDDSVVMWIKVRDCNHANFNLELYLMHVFMVLDAAVYDRPPKGLIVVIDMDGISLMHLTKLNVGLLKVYFQYFQDALPVRLRCIHFLNTVYFFDKLAYVIKPLIDQHLWNLMTFGYIAKLKPSLLKVYFDYFQEAVPIRLRAIHFFNSVWFLDKVIYVIKPFINTTLFNMLHFHQSDLDMEWFYENCLPKKCLPLELGGELPSLSVLNEKTVEKLRDMEAHFDAEELQRKRALDA